MVQYCTLNLQKKVNYRFADIWKNEVMPASKVYIRGIKRTLKSTEIFELVIIVNKYVRQKSDKGVFDYSNKDDLDHFLDFVNIQNLQD